MVVPETMAQAVHREQAYLGRAVCSLRHRALHRHGDVAHAVADTRRGAVRSRKREHVGRRADTQEPPVERLQLGVVRHADREPRPRRHTERISAAAQQRAHGGHANGLALLRGQRRAEDDSDPQRLIIPP